MKRSIRYISILAAFLTLGVSSRAQSAMIRDFKPVCDSLNTLLMERNGIASPKLSLNAIMKRGNTLDFYFTQSLCDCPWHEGDPEWFIQQLNDLIPEKYSSYSIGNVTTKKLTLDKLVTPRLGFDGTPSETAGRTGNPEVRQLVEEVDGIAFPKGLDGRHIAVWQSHGRYFDRANEKWEWQRPCLFQTVEDMFTQSFVLPYLVPMLENAGAYVLLPRERDVQRNEVIADNDPSCGARGNADYEESGSWSDAGKGFADKKPAYSGIENPFTMGTARKVSCAAAGSETARIVWRPDIPERGEYAVYVSYKSLENSTSAASYTVSHLGGKSSFAVNQKMSGSTWVYLGTFLFDEGTEGHVSLSNAAPEGYAFEEGKVVTADAVRFGGGMGNIECAGNMCEPEVSGMARSAEGARYWLQWAGISPEIFSQNDGENDYRDDFMSRGDWVEWISRGSSMNPSTKPGLGIPVDLSLGFHSDAGVTPNDSIVGTLAIYTLRSEGTDKLPNGESRSGSREYADLVQSQIVNDIRTDFEPQWSRRWIWDRSYRESRTPSCPAMLLELLSHQNFADMKYGLDPKFRFTVSRAVYKGMLKYLSNRYGCEYVVQPLPVESIGVSFAGSGKASLTWSPAVDEIEPTAFPEGFILYTRVDDGGFDNGRILTSCSRSGKGYSAEVDIKPGHIYSFRIAAYNQGGRSFPSETVSIGMPSGSTLDKKILIVNNFDRISGPTFIDTPDYAGFQTSQDSGVPHMRDIAYVGEMYQFRRELEFQSNDNPGFGGSYTDMAGELVAGNTFDYPYVHGKAVLSAGYPFYSCCNDTFCSDSTYMQQAWAADIICGKQVTTVTGNRKTEYTVFPASLQKTLRAFTSKGGHLLVSGSYIATDIWDQVYPVQTDSLFRVESKNFAQKVLGYKWGANFGSSRGTARPAPNKVFPTLANGKYSFHNEMNDECYCIEAPDGLVPASRKGAIIMRYADTNVPAAVCHQGETYRTVCFGFPLETLKEEEHIQRLITATLQYFNK